jgi:apolipoprotein D and lipocalin family protein
LPDVRRANRHIGAMTNHRCRALCAFVMLAVFAGANSGCASMQQPLRPVSHVDLQRYMGDWFVIANIPYFAEKNCVDSIESYALRTDGRIDNWFTCRKKSFDAPMKRRASAVATVTDKQGNAEWTVRFFKIVPVKYVILDLDPDYRWVAVGHPSRRYGWIMARSKTLDDPTYRAILARLAGQGYDPDKFRLVPQR